MGQACMPKWVMNLQGGECFNCACNLYQELTMLGQHCSNRMLLLAFIAALLPQCCDV